MTDQILTQSRIKHLLNYDANSGVFTWFNPKSSKSKIGDVSGSNNTTGKIYNRIMLDGKRYSAHRLAWLYIHGRFPENEIDHINGNGLDNRLSNLREVTHAENMKNAKKYKNNVSGVSGVTWNKECRKWHSHIQVDGKRKYLGLFANFNDAVAAKKAAELEHGFHINHGVAA